MKSFPAQFYPVDSPTGVPVEVEVQPGALAWVDPAGQHYVWPYAEVRQAARSIVSDGLTLEHGPPRSLLVLPDSAIVEAIRQVNPAEALRFRTHRVERWLILSRLGFILLLLLAAVLFFIYLLPDLLDRFGPLFD